MDILNWLETTVGGEFIFTLLVSMVPIIELRVGIPFGVGLGLPYPVAFIAAVIGNILPAPFIIVYIRRIFQWMRRRLPRFNGMVDALERKAHLKGKKVNKYKYLGLMLFVGIPLPGTGAWTGALAKRGELDGLPELTAFAKRLEQASVDTIESGVMTKDLAGLWEGESPAQAVNSLDFLKAIRARLEKL